jgi:hypothetical protein
VIKISRALLKKKHCHVLENLKIKMSVAGSFF